MSLSSSSNPSTEGLGMEGAADHEPAGATTATNNSSNSSNNNLVVKGKRTKRQRIQQSSTTTSTAEFSGSTTVEEEDMANCLILLAQGRSFETSRQNTDVRGEERGGGGGEKFSSRRFAEAAITTNGKAGFYVYECKTCNKCFPSFQALGGHRASHKKPKTVAAMKAMEGVDLQIGIASFPRPINTSAPSVIINNNSSSSSSNKPRVHECSICGSEFSSGQALGGHMRRHRSVPMSTLGSPEEPKKEKNLLELDLNLPAPSDDDHVGFSKSSPTAAVFSFTSKQSQLLFSALVDCHY